MILNTVRPVQYTLHRLTYMQVIELPVKHPELFEALGIDQPKVRNISCLHSLLCRSAWLQGLLCPSGWLLGLLCPPGWLLGLLCPPGWLLGLLCPSGWLLGLLCPPGWLLGLLCPPGWLLGLLCPSGWLPSFTCRACCCMGHQVPVRRCWRVLWPTILSAHSSGCPAQNWCRSSLVKVQGWCGSCSWWQGTSGLVWC